MQTEKSKPAALLRDIRDTVLHLLRRLGKSPVLLGYLAVGTAAAFLAQGPAGILQSVVNLCVLGVFAVLIRMMTARRPAAPIPLRRPKAELAAGFGMFLLILFLMALYFRVSGLTALEYGFNRFVVWTYRLAGSLGLPDWTREYLCNAFVSITTQLVPVLILFLAFGYGPGKMGFRPRYGLLTLILLAITMLVGLTYHSYIPLYTQPVTHTALLFLIQLFINGMAEELYFRGYMLPRLEAVLKNPAGALVVSSLLFSAMHIPVNIADNGAGYAFLNVLSISFPSGLLWGYLYQRTRSIVPGMLFHTAYGILGFYFYAV